MSGWTRRRVLSAGALAGLAACSGSRPATGDATTTAADRVVPSRIPATMPAIAQRAEGPVVDAADAGVDADGGSDVTAALQAALDDAAGGILHVPAGRYMINTDPETGGSLRVRSDTTVVFAPGAVLEAIPNAKDFSYLLLVEDVENVVISGGLFVGDRFDHQADSGEQGHLVSVFHATDVLIADVTVTEAWGDGIIVGYADEPGTESRRIAVVRAHAFNNRRLGMSVIGAHDVTISDSVFERNNGTEPAAGIDIEPEPGYEVVGVAIHNCRFLANEGDGLLFGGLPSDGAIRNVSITSCTAERNGIDGVAVFETAGVTVDGLVARQNVKSGLSLNDVTDVDVASSTLADNGEHGLIAEPGPRALNLVAATIVRNGGGGVTLRPGWRDCRMVGGLVGDNGDTGVDLRDGARVHMDGVTLADNAGGAARFDGSSEIFLTGCVVRAHAEAGGPSVAAESSTGLRVVSTSFTSTGGAHVSLSGGSGDGAVIAGNIFQGRGGDGVDAGDAEVRDNIVV